MYNIVPFKNVQQLMDDNLYKVVPFSNMQNILSTNIRIKTIKKVTSKYKTYMGLT